MKTPNAACGSVGVFTYEMRQEQAHNDDYRKMAVMFSVPYDYGLYSTHCAVGVADTNVPCDRELYEKMYYGETNSWFDRFTASVGDHVYKTADFTIKCKMVDGYELTLMINVQNAVYR